MRADGILYDLNEEIPLEKNKKHTVELVVDRLVLRPDLRRRLADSLETACAHAGGLVTVHLPGENRDLDFSQNYACADCGISLSELEPRMFSYNTPYGACPECTGLGFRLESGPGSGDSRSLQVHSGGGHSGLRLEQRAHRLHFSHVF